MGNLGDAVKYLRDNRVKKGDSVASAARSDRMNAIADAIISLARGDHMRAGPAIRLKTGDGMVIISSTAGDGGGGGDDTVHPFKVSATTKDDYTAIEVYPGLILNQVPYIDGVLMNQTVTDSFDQQVPNTFTPPAIDFSVWLITRIANTSDNYHPRIDIAQPDEISYVPVLPADQSCYITIVAPAEVDRIDFRIKWDSDGSREAGWFPIRIADVKMEAAAPGDTTGPKVTSITQYVFNSWRSLILSESDIIPISY